MSGGRFWAVVAGWSPETRRLVAQQVAFMMSPSYAADTLAKEMALARLENYCRAVGGDFDKAMAEVRRRQGLGMSSRSAVESVAGDIGAGRWTP